MLRTSRPTRNSEPRSRTRRLLLQGLAATAALLLTPLRALAQAARVSTVAGNGVAGYENDLAGLPATSTPVNNPYGVVVGPDGALYFCEVDTGRTRRVSLTDGRTLFVPLAWFPRLAHASHAERAAYEILGDGEGIHWPQVDEDISVAGLLAGQPSAEVKAAIA